MPSRRRKTPRPILRVIKIFVGGRVIKTSKCRLSLRQAVREVGEDCWPTKGAARSYSRRSGPVSISFRYEAVMDMLDAGPVVVSRVSLDTRGAVDAIRGNLAG